MKKLFSVVTTIVLLFNTMGVSVVDAKVRSGSRSGVKTSIPKTNTNKSTTNKTVDDSNTKTTTNTTKDTNTVKSSTLKNKSSYEGTYYKPDNFNSSQYSGKSYYSRNGFATTMMSNLGTFLILDAILDDGTPVYVDSETGEVVDENTLENAEAVEVEDGNGIGGFIPFLIIAALIGFVALEFRKRRRYA